MENTDGDRIGLEPESPFVDTMLIFDGNVDVTSKQTLINYVVSKWRITM